MNNIHVPTVKGSNRHIVDQLAEARTKKKQCENLIKTLSDKISAAMGSDDSLCGDGYIAHQKITERKGSLDLKKLEESGVDVEAFRKPPVLVHTIRVEERVNELA